MTDGNDRERGKKLRQNRLLEIIRAEIEQSPTTSISFYRFMELCLYHPLWGYYCQDKIRFGKQGDFFTNAQVGSLFGQMLARYFLQLHSQEQDEGRWALVEVGAGDGQLMNTIISFFRAWNIKNVDFYIVEKGKRPQHIEPVIQWVEGFDRIPTYSLAIIYSNEWFDAMPIYRVQKKEGVMHEIHLTWDQKEMRLRETLVPLSNEALLPLLTHVEERLAEGQRFEINLDAKRWLQQIADWLTVGYLVTIDYGGELEELLLRKEGTVRYFQQHQLVENTDLQPGEVDITANVNFTWLQEWGEAFGLQTLFYGTQTKFLLQDELLFSIQKEKERNQLKQLIHPYGMGEVFRVLVQKKALAKG